MKVRDGKSRNEQINYFAVLIVCSIIAATRREIEKERGTQKLNNCPSDVHLISDYIWPVSRSAVATNFLFARTFRF